ncbi:hypothetical protein ABK040_005575 [Willaertia magna]
MPLFGFFKKKESSSNEKPNSDLAKRLQQKDAGSWTVNEVGIWLDLVGLGEYKPAFINNSISGQELLELQEDDMNQLQITKLGHRKKFKKLVQALNKNSNITNFLETLSDASGDVKDIEINSTSTSSQQQSPSINNTTTTTTNNNNNNLKTNSSVGSNDEILSNNTFAVSDVVFKCFHNSEVHLIGLKRDKATFSELKLRIIEEYNCLKPIIKYKDTEGDFITIRKEDDFLICLQNVPADSAVRLYVTTENDNEDALSQSSQSDSSGQQIAAYNVVQRHIDRYPSIYSELDEPEVDEGTMFLEDLVDAVVIITDDKTIQYINKSAERCFAYDRKEVIGRNVKVLMSNPIHTAKHDDYVDNYLKTGIAKIIGTGRAVDARSKDGVVFPIWLSVAESQWLGRHAFTATIQDLRKSDKSKQQNTGVTSLLENLVDAVFIIDTKCDICFMNKSAEKMFGFNRSELLGKNVKVLMPEKYAAKHDEFVQNYLTTGEKHVIGKGRKVTAKDKQGILFSIWLSVSETKWSGQSAFVGTIQDLRKENNIEKLLV